MSEDSYLIDTHCHLHDREFFTAKQAEAMLERAHAANVQKIICVGTNPADSLQACNFANAHKNVFWTYGIHPEYAQQYNNSSVLAGLPSVLAGSISGVRSHDEEKRLDSATAGVENAPRDRTKQVCSAIPPAHPCAIGEIGLDYHYDSFNRTAQLRLFEQMLQLSLDYNLPVSLHVRNAFDDAFAVLDNFSGVKILNPKDHQSPKIVQGIRGVIHSFTGSKKDLKKALARDFYIGVNGLATYSTLPMPPLERILLETDAPFLTPVPFRGTMNEPSYVREVATYLSEKLGVAETNLMEQTTKNARKIFQI